VAGGGGGRIEAAHGQVGVAAHDADALEEGEDPVAGQPRPVGDPRADHVLVERLGAAVGAHEDVRVDERDLGMGVQEVGRARERSRLVPRVVLGEGDVRRVDRRDPRRAARRAPVLAELDDPDPRERAADVAAVPSTEALSTTTTSARSAAPRARAARGRCGPGRSG